MDVRPFHKLTLGALTNMLKSVLMDFRYFFVVAKSCKKFYSVLGRHRGIEQ